MYQTLPAHRRGITLQQAALPCLFIQFGLICGSWGARIPAVRDTLGLSPTALSFVLLCGGLGAVLSFPFAAWLMARFGGRRTTWYSGIVLLCALPCLALSPHIAPLMMAMLLFGIACGCFDVGVNSVGTRLERISGRPIMSMLHAWFCVGAFLGALSGSAMAGLGVPPHKHFLLLAAFLAPPLQLCYRALPGEDLHERPPRKSLSLPRGPLLLLGLIGFFGAMSEGSIADWSGIFMKDHLGASDGLAPVALTAFSMMMLCARLMGDRIKGPYGARRLLAVGGLFSAAGLFLATLAGNPMIAIIGFGIAGAGLALVFPFVFSAAGRLGPTELAGVATLSYSGSLMGPPAVGAAAQFLGLPAAIGFLALLSIGIAAAASRASLLE